MGGDPSEAPVLNSDEIGQLRERLRPFLKQHGIEGDFTLAALPGGANNRVFRLTQAGREFALKSYFQNPGDPRDRFGAERAFYELLWRHGVRRTPEPLAWEAEQRAGLFEFVNGRKLDAGEVDRERVGEALAFVVELNQCRAVAGAAAVPVASEACFSVAEHLALIGQRVARLQQIEATTELDQEAAAFAREQLMPEWRRLADAISKSAGAMLGKGLGTGERCLSPSDFGFHNALLPADGRLRFFDFEYAGWDDPAKLVCDFFCQPQLPVAHGEWDTFVGPLARALGQEESLPARARLLLPVYQVKWCCIMLNDFVRADRARRDFAGVGGRKAVQLARAREALRAAVQERDCQA